MKNPGVEIVVCKVVSNSLEKAMEDAGLTQEETAKRVGSISSRQLTRIRDLEHCPSLERALALSVVLGVPLEKLFKIEIETRHVRS